MLYETCKVMNMQACLVRPKNGACLLFAIVIQLSLF